MSQSSSRERAGESDADALGRADVQAVLRRAAELQQQQGTARGEDAALTEDELAAVAAESGLAPEHVRAAVRELRAGVLRSETPPRDRRWPYVLGGSPTLDLERTLHVPAGEDTVGALIVALSDALELPPPDRHERHGRSFVGTYEGGAKRVTVAAEGERTRIRLRVKHRRGAFVAYAAVLVGWAVLAAALTPSAGVGLLVAGALLLAVRLLVSLRIDGRERRLNAVLDNMEARVLEASPP